MESSLLAVCSAARALAPVVGVLERLGRGALELLAPGFCRACGDALEGGAALCNACSDEIRWIPEACGRCGFPLPRAGGDARRTPFRESACCSRCRRKRLCFDGARAAADYEGPLRALILRYKFHGDLGALGFLVEALAWAHHRHHRAYRRGSRRTSRLVTSVPQHFTRTLRRARDPARDLAAALARRIGWRFRPLLVKRQRTPPQISLSRAGRRGNLRGSFRLRRRVHLPERILLVDDVFTTGATASECARVLKRGGAREVVVLTAAKTL